MTRIEWEEDTETDDQWASINLTVVTDDPAMLAKAKRLLRQLVSDAPSLAAVPRKDDGDE
jgi:hypothetical protein